MNKLTKEELANLPDTAKDLYEEALSQNDLVILAQSKGGKKLTSALKKDIIAMLDTVSSDKTHVEFIAWTEKFKTLLTVYKTLINAETNRDALDSMFADSLTG